MNTIRFCFVLTAILLFANETAAQSITPQQKAEVLRQLEGMSQSDIEDRISALGMSREEAEKRARENGIDLQTYLQGTSNLVPTPSTQIIIESGPQKELVTDAGRGMTELGESKPVEMKNGLQYFGYAIFRQTPSSFEPTADGPIDPDYIIGPDDVLRVSIWGQVEQQNELTVDKEGRIFIPTAGPIVVSGLTVTELQKMLTKQLSRAFQGLTSNPPAVWLDVTLAKIRPKRVFIMGEVANPGGYTVSSYATVFNSLFSVGGPTTNGSLREVRLIRGNKVIAKVDLYSYLTGAEKNNDVRVQNNDIIYVPVRKSTVFVKGEIRRPGIYELLQGENLKRLVEFAGGNLPTSYLERAQIERIVPLKERVKSEAERKYFDVNYREIIAKNVDFALADGDIITLYSINREIRNFVHVSGAVRKPGTYQWTKGMTLRQLILLADSLRPETYSIRGEITRTLSDDRTLTTIPFDLGSTMTGDAGSTVVLEPKDNVLIHSIDIERIPDQFVELFGSVRRPGKYPLTNNLTLTDLVMAAGGYTENVSMLEAEIARIDADRYNDTLAVVLTAPLPQLRDSLKVTGFSYYETLRKTDFVLVHRDKVYIRPNPAYRLQSNVKITGEVKYSGEFALVTNNDYISDLIKRSGGVTSAAYLRGSKLFRHGERVNVDFKMVMDAPKSSEDVILHSGDSIYIPKKPNSVRVSGEVNNPGLLGFIEGQQFWDYIERAGGLTDSADYIVLYHPNGNAERYRVGFFGGNDEVYDGSTIHITKIPTPPIERKELDIGNLIRDLFAITASALTILVLSRQL